MEPMLIALFMANLGGTEGGAGNAIAEAVVGNGFGPTFDGDVPDRGAATFHEGMSIADPDCKLHCRGTCFAGHCLFTGIEGNDGVSVESAIETQPLKLQPNGGVSVDSALETQPLKLQPHGGVSVDSALEAQPLYLQPPQPPKLAAQVGLLASQARWPRSQIPLPRETRNLARFLAPTPAPAQPPQPVAWAQRRQANEQIATLERETAHLEEENKQLRQQLARWHHAGASVAAREAQLASLLIELKRSQLLSHDAGGTVNASGAKDAEGETGNSVNGATQPPGGKKVEVESKDEASQSRFGLLLLQGTGFAVLTDAFDHINGISMLVWLEVALVLCAGCCAFVFREALAKLSSGALSGDQQVPSSSSKLSAVMRELGVSDFVVEVSELQVGYLDFLKPDTEVGVQIAIGWNRPVHTRIMHLLTGNRAGMVSFKEVFHLGISKIDGPCVFSLYDREGLHSGADPIARVRVPARALVNMAQERREFYRLDLEPSPSAEIANSGRPYIAMRIRDQSDKAMVAGNQSRDSISSSR